MGCPPKVRGRIPRQRWKTKRNRIGVVKTSPVSKRNRGWTNDRIKTQGGILKGKTVISLTKVREERGRISRRNRIKKKMKGKKGLFLKVVETSVKGGANMSAQEERLTRKGTVSSRRGEGGQKGDISGRLKTTKHQQRTQQKSNSTKTTAKGKTLSNDYGTKNRRDRKPQARKKQKNVATSNRGKNHDKTSTSPRIVKGYGWAVESETGGSEGGSLGFKANRDL